MRNLAAENGDQACVRHAAGVREYRQLPNENRQSCYGRGGDSADPEPTSQPGAKVIVIGS